MMSPGKHGLIIMRKYHERGQKCPVAVIAGMHASDREALSRLRSDDIAPGKLREDGYYDDSHESRERDRNDTLVAEFDRRVIRARRAAWL